MPAGYFWEYIQIYTVWDDDIHTYLHISSIQFNCISILKKYEIRINEYTDDEYTRIFEMYYNI